MTRQFTDYDAATVRKPKPLLIGITGPSASGKTYSALRLASGVQKVTGGDIYFIDTEADRALHYQDRFKFRHVPFAPPHSPEAYSEAIAYALSKGAKVVIVDSMTHEHNGEGGVLDQIEEFMEAHQHNESYKWTAQIKPKGQRRRLNREIVGHGASAVFIFLYRADDKTKPVQGGKPIHVGWQAETTSKLPYEMTIRFLLEPGADGHPSLNPDTEFEKMSIKLPEQFRGWFKPGLQLNEDLGEKLARWSVGEEAKPVDANRDAVASEIKRLKWKRDDAKAFFRANYSVDTFGELTPEQQAASVVELRKVPT
jgi:hypothetical protein